MVGYTLLQFQLYNICDSVHLLNCAMVSTETKLLSFYKILRIIHTSWEQRYQKVCFDLAWLLPCFRGHNNFSPFLLSRNVFYLECCIDNLQELDYCQLSLGFYQSPHLFSFLTSVHLVSHVILVMVIFLEFLGFSFFC